MASSTFDSEAELYILNLGHHRRDGVATRVDVGEFVKRKTFENENSDGLPNLWLQCQKHADGIFTIYLSVLKSARHSRQASCEIADRYG